MTIENLTDFSKKSKKSVVKSVTGISIFLCISFLIIFLINFVTPNQFIFSHISVASLNMILIGLIALSVFIIGYIIIYEINKVIEVSRKISLLIDLGNQFQACSSRKRIAYIAAQFLEKVFSESKGIIYLMHPHYNYLEAAVKWGAFASTNGKKINFIKPKKHHSTATLNVKYDEVVNKCVVQLKNKDLTRVRQALVTNNHLLGLIQIEYKEKNERANEQKKKILAIVTKSSALALANIKLRDLLESKSTHDPLTGLHNRSYLNDYFASQLNLAERQHKKIAVIMFDIDHFKEFNDEYGHSAGDQLLKAMGTLMQGETRMSDAVCRYGGEEFIWILYDCGIDAAKLRAEGLRNKVLNISINYQDNTCHPVSISLGISDYPDDASHVKDLIIAADEALYQAKRTGRNKVVTYSEINPISNINTL
jgi:diguanylate cyclase (GGDEF)-like protein